MFQILNVHVFAPKGLLRLSHLGTMTGTVPRELEDGVAHIFRDFRRSAQCYPIFVRSRLFVRDFILRESRAASLRRDACDIEEKKDPYDDGFENEEKGAGRRLLRHKDILLYIRCRRNMYVRDE